MRLHQVGLSTIIMATGITMSSCVGGGAFFTQRLTGKYALWAMDGLAGNSLVEESADGRASKVLIGPTVFSAGFDDQFIIVARHPETGPLQFDRKRTEYYVVTIADGSVHGPADGDSFTALRQKLQVPANLHFSVTLQQLAQGQSANKRVNLTVQAARALRLSGRAPLRTVARKARATRPAGYAQRSADKTNV